MFDIFNVKRNSSNNPLHLYPKWSYISGIVRNNIARVVKFYRGFEYQVSNNNILVYLLNSITTNKFMTDALYIEEINKDIIYKANSLGIGIGGNRPKVFRDNIYSNSYEVFIGKKSTIDLEKNWETLIPLRPLYHSNSTLDYEIRKRRNMNGDMCVFEIDLTALAYMYKKWFHRRLKEDRSTKPHIFIHQYVLPNLLKYDINLVLFNRFMEFLIVDKLPSFNTRNYSFFYIDISKMVDEVLKHCFKDLYNKKIPIDRLINTIPIIKFDKIETMLDVLRLPIRLDRIELRWVKWGSRISYIKNIIMLLGIEGFLFNKPTIYKLYDDFKLIASGNVRIPNELDNTKEKILSDVVFLKDFIFPNMKLKIK